MNSFIVSSPGHRGLTWLLWWLGGLLTAQELVAKPVFWLASVLQVYHINAEVPSCRGLPRLLWWLGGLLTAQELLADLAPPELPTDQ